MSSLFSNLRLVTVALKYPERKYLRYLIDTFLLLTAAFVPEELSKADQ